MMGYRDRAWCNSSDCDGSCGRQWTDELQAKAEAWWGGPDPPVAFTSDFEHKGPTEPVSIRPGQVS